MTILQDHSEIITMMLKMAMIRVLPKNKMAIKLLCDSNSLHNHDLIFGYYLLIHYLSSNGSMVLISSTADMYGIPIFM